jgi:molybdenum cofactor cytidylyltransferase
LVSQSPPEPIRVDAAVLAAGRGKRMGGAKHLIEIEGVAMLERVLRSLAGSRVVGVRVVLRPGDAAGCELVEGLGFAWTLAAEPEHGRAASVRAGVESVDPAAAGLLFALADQPYLLPTDFDSVVSAFEADPQAIVRATYAGEPGSPVLFARRFFPELQSLSPGQGGRAVAMRHPEALQSVAIDPDRGRDLDRPDDLD